MTFTSEFAQMWINANVLLIRRSRTADEVTLRCKLSQEDLHMLFEQQVIDLDEYTHSLTKVLTARAARIAELAIQEACY